MFDDIELTGIQDENARQLIMRLLNLIEQLSADLREARAEMQRLRDENNRLKGEHGKPKIKGNTPKRPAADHSSEKERHKPQRHAKRSKKATMNSRCITTQPNWPSGSVSANEMSALARAPRTACVPGTLS